MSSLDDVSTAFGLLQLTSQLVDGIQAGMAARGFDDVRPQHGFAFVRIAAGDATVADVAAHLGVTKQASAQLVDHLVKRGYVTREPHPRDGRAQLLRLTPHGRACTRAAEEAAAQTVAGWGATSRDDLAALHRAVAALARPGRLRPAW